MLHNLGISGLLLIVAYLIALAINRRTRPRFEYVDQRSKLITIIGTLIGPLVAIVVGAGTLIGPPDSWLAQQFAGRPYEFIPPLTWGVVAVALWLFASRPGTQSGPQVRVAELHQRSILTFAPRRGLLAVALLTVSVLVITVIAGLASQPGRDDGYREYSYNTESGGVTSYIYGWYWSVPSMITLAVLLMLAYTVLYKIAAPTLSDDREADIAIRRYQSSTVTFQVAAAIALHLASVLISLGETAGLAGYRGDTLVSWTPFAALGPSLWILGYASMTASFTIWSYLLLRSRSKRYIHTEAQASVLEKA